MAEERLKEEVQQLTRLLTEGREEAHREKAHLQREKEDLRQRMETRSREFEQREREATCDFEKNETNFELRP
ncbi:MAG: hypothetical protein GY820_21990 [Gammaproteobacteria bacterium]|nr:hypothetical protein [Gammaproteobacteria bacterium]